MKLRKVFLPKWYAVFILIIMLPLWIWITYGAFYTKSGQEELGLIGWVVMSIVLLGTMVFMLLMAFRKLPAYLIEE